MRLKASALSILCLLALTASPARAADPASWHRVLSATTPSALEGVSCGTVTFCVGVGGDVAVEDGGPLYEDNPDVGSGLNAVSCAPGSHFCVAVDSNGGEVTYSGDGFGPDVQFAGNNELESVSCPTVGHCMAVEHTFTGSPFKVYKLSGGSWDSGTSLPVASGITGSSEPRISCAAETFCVVVANTSGGERYWTYKGSGWTLGASAMPGRPDGSNTVSITCTSATFCLSTSKTGDASRFNGTSWSTQHIDSHGVNQLASSCSGTTCRAIDRNDNAYNTSDGTTWTANTPANIRASTGFSGASAMSCPSADICVAGDPVGQTTLYGLSIVPAAPPVVSGTGQAGQTLTVTTRSRIDNPLAWFFDEWWRCDNPGSTCTQIPDAHGPTYTLTADDVGKYIDVLEGTGIGLDEEAAQERSNPIEVPAAAPPPSGPTPPAPSPPDGGSPAPAPVVVPPKIRAPGLAKTSTSRKGLVTLSFSCPKGGAPCTGALGLSFKSGKKRKAAGSGRYSVAAGKKGTAKVKLNKAARKVLLRRHSLAVVLKIKPAGAKATTRTLTLKLPRTR